jgi:hypothetical protein
MTPAAVRQFFTQLLGGQGQGQGRPLPRYQNRRAAYNQQNPTFLAGVHAALARSQDHIRRGLAPPAVPQAQANAAPQSAVVQGGVPGGSSGVPGGPNINVAGPNLISDPPSTVPPWAPDPGYPDAPLGFNPTTSPPGPGDYPDAPPPPAPVDSLWQPSTSPPPGYTPPPSLYGAPPPPTDPWRVRGGWGNQPL